jgi:regulatory protein
LASQITKIEKQQKNKNRYSIFLNGEYSFSVISDVFTRRKLRIGQSLSEKEIEVLRIEDEKVRSKIQAYKILARRNNSEKELEDKLKRKGFSQSTIKFTLTDLKQKHLLDDEVFAELFARNRIILHPVGKRQLAFELKHKGISESLIDQTIEKIFSEFNEQKLADSLANKKMKTLKNQPPQKIKKKLGDFLVRRGFNWEIVQNIFDEQNFNDNVLED